MADKSGVYKFTSPSGNVYIGQTSNFDRRKVEHRYSSKKTMNKLYASFRKYGMDNHKFEILFLSDDAYEKNRMEQFYIDYYNSVKLGLNLIDVTRGVNSFSGKKHSKEEVERIKERMKGFVPIEAIKKRSKKIYCKSNDKTYNSLSSCARDLKVSQSYISQMVNGKVKNNYNLKFV